MSQPLIWAALLLTFLAAMLLVLGLGRLMVQGQANRRLRGAVGRPQTSSMDAGVAGPRSPGQATVARLMDSLSRLSVPEGGWQDSALRIRFLQAGLRSPSAPRTYYGIKTIFTLLVPAMVGVGLWLFVPGMKPRNLALVVVLLAAVGYYAPDLYLRLRTASRMKSMRNTLPDLIDLLVICTESGLGMDAAINRVSQDIARSSPPLAEEFYLTALEIRAGAGRMIALKNLALRAGLEDLSSLVAMLVQADKFGTSLAESLRIQSDLMRVKRMQRAEEQAAKIPVKMLIPLVFFIFPSLLGVLIGPAFLQIAKTFAKQGGG